MKSERRHELKTNSLAQAMTKLPESGVRSVVSGVVIVLAGVLIGLLIRYRISAGQQRVTDAGNNLAIARNQIDQIRLYTGQGADASLPHDALTEALTRLDQVLADVGSGSPALAAEALVARGDAYWFMSQFDAATTQPAVGQSAAELLNSAKAAYQQVVSSYPQQHFSAAAAHFGLAAIAENQHDWAGARSQYQAVADDTGGSETMQELAKTMLKGVDDLEHPPLIAPATQEAVPATQENLPSAGGQPSIATQPARLP